MTMKNKVKLLFLLLFVFAIGGQAQIKNGIDGPEISFSKTNHQLGSIKEEAGDVNIDFEFTNTGIGDLLISDVKADKGVEVKSWPKNAIANGETGIISVIFHPKENYYSVKKSVTVLSNSLKNKKTVLTIRGNVVPEPGSIAAKYRRNLGNTGLMVKNNSLFFGDISANNKNSKSLEVYNNSNESMEISFKDVPKFMTVVAEPAVLEPKQQGKITIDYKPELNTTSNNKQKWGAQNSRISVVINGDIKNSIRNSITVRANIVEDFSKLSEKELAKAPKIEFTNKTFNFGTITQGETVKHDFVYTNLGDSDLEIRYVKST